MDKPLNLMELLDFCNGGMTLTIFDGRYSDGIIAYLTTNSEHASAIADNLTGGDTDWEIIRFGTAKLGWFPIVYVQDVSQVVSELQAKLNEIEKSQSNYRDWLVAVERIGSLIDDNKHWDLLFPLTHEPETKYRDCTEVLKYWDELPDK